MGCGVPTVTVELTASWARPAGGCESDAKVTWQEDVAPGETLGRLLERLVNERTSFREIYDPAGRRIADHVQIAINGRAYHLLGGLTYLLKDGDTLTVAQR
jgi:molybdopterin converting factor small subunit